MKIGKNNIKAFVRFTMTAAVVTMVLTCSGCGSKAEQASQKAVAKSRTMFQEVIQDFDEQKDQVRDEIQEGKDVLLTFKEAIREAKDKDAEFAKVHNKWEAVGAEVTKLHNVFERLVRTADGFYAGLENRANTIGDIALRDNTLRKISDSRDNYVVRLKQSKSKIDQLDVVNGKVRDTITALEIHFSLEVLEKKLSETFEEINRMVSAIMHDLESLSKESRALLAEVR